MSKSLYDIEYYKSKPAFRAGLFSILIGLVLTFISVFIFFLSDYFFLLLNKITSISFFCVSALFIFLGIGLCSASVHFTNQEILQKNKNSAAELVCLSRFGLKKQKSRVQAILNNLFIIILSVLGIIIATIILISSLSSK